MYAIIKTGGKQYRVEKDDIIDVELLNTEQGTQVEFKDVLFVNDGSNVLVGEPIVGGYSVIGEVAGDSTGPKVVSLKYKPRQHQQKKWGHRQRYTRVKIIEIGSVGKAKTKAAAKKAETKPKAEAKPKAAAETKPKAAPKRQAKEKKEE